MTKTRIKTILLTLIILILSLVACSSNVFTPSEEKIESLTAQNPSSSLEEYVVIELPIPTSIQAASMEFSGLAWYQDWLVLLPQYPNRGASGKPGSLYAINKAELLSFIAGETQNLSVITILFDDQGLFQELKGFEGYEAIAFIEEKIILTIETSGGNPMKSFLVCGRVDGELDEIVLDKNSLIEIETQNSSRNASYEAFTFDDENIYAIYEQNGAENNDQPYALMTDAELRSTETIPIEPVNYRITDASMMDAQKNFWAINYFYPGDTHLAVDSDPISETYGLPGTHQVSEPVERLIQFQHQDGKFVLTNTPPVYLQLLPQDEARNWEGLVLLDDLGFILVTDSFPKTILGLVLMR